MEEAREGPAGGVATMGDQAEGKVPGGKLARSLLEQMDELKGALCAVAPAAIVASEYVEHMRAAGFYPQTPDPYWTELCRAVDQMRALQEARWRSLRKAEGSADVRAIAIARGSPALGALLATPQI